MNDLKSRIEALETKIGQMNTEIAALQKIVDDAVTVVKVEKSADGYVIYFSDNTTAEIKNGIAGADAPVIGVKQDTDEVYYWTITTDGKTGVADGRRRETARDGRKRQTRDVGR